METGIILQVRTGSTRLPMKMIQAFYKEKSILEILLERYIGNPENKIPLVIATTKNPQDNIIEDIAKLYNVSCFRGSEENVLLRFIDTANHYGFNNIIRVCGDNPFFDFDGTYELLANNNSKKHDYITYKVDQDKPSILSHLGFWGEVVTLNALKRIIDLTSNQFYLEHVTNYIYHHPDKFSIKLVQAPEKLGNRNDIRLTVDTKADFEMNQLLHQQITEQKIPFEPKQIVNFIDEHSYFKQIMLNEIETNKK